MVAFQSHNLSRPNGLDEGLTPGSCRFELRMADFMLPRIRSLLAAKPSHFYQGLAKRMAAFKAQLAAVAVL